MHPNHTAREISKRLDGCSEHAILHRARTLQLKKSKAFYAKYRNPNQEPKDPRPVESPSRKAAQELGISYVKFSKADSIPPCPSQLELIELLQASIKPNNRPPRLLG
jgi:hypothetical protein